MKIAFKIERVNYGGGERVILALANSFKTKGHEIIFISHNEDLQSVGVLPSKCILIGKHGCPTKSRLRRILSVNRICKEENIDVLIIFGPEPYIALGTLFTKTKLLYSLRVDPQEIKSPFQWTVKLVHLLANGIVFQTSIVQDFYPKFVKKKSIVIPNPILDDLIPVSNVRKKKIVGIGRLSDQKNFSMLVRAVAKIDLRKYTVHIYGKGENEESLRKQIQENRLENKVFLEGFVQNTLEAIKDAEIFVLSSNSEGMPNALIEAMCMKMACISTDVPSGGARYLIENHKNGILIPVNDSDKLAEELQFLIDNDVCREAYSNEAYKIRSILSKDKIINNWIKYIESI